MSYLRDVGLYADFTDAPSAWMLGGQSRLLWLSRGVSFGVPMHESCVDGRLVYAGGVFSGRVDAMCALRASSAQASHRDIVPLLAYSNGDVLTLEAGVDAALPVTESSFDFSSDGDCHDLSCLIETMETCLGDDGLSCSDAALRVCATLFGIRGVCHAKMSARGNRYDYVATIADFLSVDGGVSVHTAMLRHFCAESVLRCIDSTGVVLVPFVSGMPFVAHDSHLSVSAVERARFVGELDVDHVALFVRLCDGYAVVDELGASWMSRHDVIEFLKFVERRGVDCPEGCLLMGVSRHDKH